MILAVRRPGQPIAWMLLAHGDRPARSGRRASPRPLEELLTGPPIRWASSRRGRTATGWVFVFAGFIGIALIFPGRITCRPDRWGRSVGCSSRTTMPPSRSCCSGPDDERDGARGIRSATDVPNPYACVLPGAAWRNPPPNAFLWVVIFGLTLVGPCRCSCGSGGRAGHERLQYRWLAWAVCWSASQTWCGPSSRSVLRVEFAPLAARDRGAVLPRDPGGGGDRRAPVPPLRHRPARQSNARLGPGDGHDRRGVRGRGPRAPGRALGRDPERDARRRRVDAARVRRCSSRCAVASRRSSIAGSTVRGWRPSGSSPAMASGCGTRRTSSGSRSASSTRCRRRSGRRAAGVWIRHAGAHGP